MIYIFDQYKIVTLNLEQYYFKAVASGKAGQVLDQTTFFADQTCIAHFDKPTHGVIYTQTYKN